MAGNFTFTMIKPGAVNHEHIGPILTMINDAGFKIIAMKFLKLYREEAEEFYSIHKGKPFYNELVEFMTSAPVVVAVLQKENAVEDYRKLMGSTNPSGAQEGTIRKMFAESVTKNAVHGSDSDSNAVKEANFFFSKREQYPNYGIDHSAHLLKYRTTVI
ncbi:MAG: nucleoside-diphosphate kinase [Bacteroidota bacterium]